MPILNRKFDRRAVMSSELKPLVSSTMTYRSCASRTIILSKQEWLHQPSMQPITDQRVRSGGQNGMDGYVLDIERANEPLLTDQ